MPTVYKPTLRFDAIETRRINAAADAAGLKPAEWMRKLALEHAPPLTIADPLAVRVDGFEEQFGWNLIHYADALAHAETLQAAEVSDIADMAPYTISQDGELWIDGDKLPGVSAADGPSVEARAVDFCRAINKAHIRALLATQGGWPVGHPGGAGSDRADQAWHELVLAIEMTPRYIGGNTREVRI